MTHVPVMVTEVLRYLLYDGSKTVLDATVGAGGHAAAILEQSPDVRLIGIDRDPTALGIAADRLSRFGDRFRLVEAEYSNLSRVLEGEGKVDGVLADLGVSSMQLDRSERGFSHGSDGPLDMRMGGTGVTAREWLEQAAVDEISETLRVYGEIRGAKRIARSIKAAADTHTLFSTEALKAAAGRGLGRVPSPSLLSRIFQAIRIHVNAELDHLDRFLGSILSHLEESARLVFIAYHSLEDRAVKTFLKQQSASCICPPGTPVCVCGHTPSIEVLTRRAVKPTAAEVDANPRARSARLRAARVLAEEEK